MKRLEDIGVPADRLHYYENLEGGHGKPETLPLFMQIRGVVSMLLCVCVGGAADNKQQAFVTVLYNEFLYKTICLPTIQLNK